MLSSNQKSSFRALLSRDRSGVATLEFALFTIPFMALLVGLIEIGMIFLAQTGFERQTDVAARMIKTGQAQNQAWSQNEIARLICSGLFAGSSCTQNIRIDVRPLGNASQTRNFSDQRIEETSALNFGASNDIVIIRAEYHYQPFFSAGGVSPLTGANGEPYVFSAAMAFRNEPF